MARHVVVLLNAKAGTNAAAETREQVAKVRAALVAHGATADVRAVEGRHLAAAAKRAAGEAGVDVVAAGGGDGTQSAVAGALAGTEMPMGVLPLGTLNHFAKDLGLPLTLEESAAVVATGVPRPVDVGRVNGRVFVNNSSIGVYPHVVRHRDQLRETLGHGKWYAMLIAVLNLFTRRMPRVHLRLTVNGEEHEHRTPFVFVGNNVYELELLMLGQRKRLDAGQLCLYFTPRSGRLAMVRLALRALFNRLRQDRDFNAVCSGEVWIDTKRKRLNVAMDGEVEPMDGPLHYQIWPGALRVIVPAKGASPAGSG